jgi:hypothetical protein
MLIYTWGNMEHISGRRRGPSPSGLRTNQQARDYVASKMLGSSGKLVATATVTTTVSANPWERGRRAGHPARRRVAEVLPFRAFGLQTLQSTARVRLET